MSALAKKNEEVMNGFFTTSLKDADKELFATIENELARQQNQIEFPYTFQNEKNYYYELFWRYQTLPTKDLSPR